MARPTQRRDVAAIVRGMAMQKGYTADRAPIKGLWFLTEDATGKKAEKPNCTTAYTEQQAIKFLKRLPDAN